MSRPALVRSFLPLLLLFALRSAVPAQCVGTPVGGLITNAHWTIGGSPYCVTSNLSLLDVRIDPGVIVQADGNFSIAVIGGLVAAGTALDPIRFTSTTLNWNGIHFQSSPPNSLLRHCVVENADQPGISVVESFPRIEDCTIQNNQTTVSGAGMRIEITTGHFSLRGCSLLGNRSTTSGGGMFVDMGGGFACVLDDCIVEDNHVNQSAAAVSEVGGGIYFAPGDGQLVLSGCRVSANTVSSISGFATGLQLSRGAGLYAGGGDVRLVGTSFDRNWTRGYDEDIFGSGLGRGAAVYFSGPGKALEIRNCSFHCNSALVPTTNEATGSSLYLEDGTATIENSTFARNGVVWPGSPDPTVYVAGGTATLRNCILYWNNPGGSCAGVVTYGPQIGGPGTTTVTFSDVQGPIPGNLDVNPAFLNSGNPNCNANLLPDCSGLDLALAPGSPCIDAGQTGVAFRDACFPPSQGGVRNDMGFTGGPQACSGAGPALLVGRTGGQNPSTYTSDPIVIGGTWHPSVACPGTGQPLFLIGLYEAPLNLQLGNGYVVLVNITRPRLVTIGPAPCATPQSIPVPADTALVGATFYSQAVHFGASSFALSNSQDFVVGTF